MSLNKIVVVKRATQLEELLKRYSTTSQVKFYLESRNASYDSYRNAHDAYHQGLEKTVSKIPKEMRCQIIDKDVLSTFKFGDKDLVVVVGDDGLLVNVAKYIGEQPVISVNPDPERFDGVLACCTPKNFSQILQKTLESKASIEYLTMAEARLDDGQVIYALNDLFIGKNSHASARYEIEYSGNKEKQSSSGIIISTGTGSTGWLTSVMIGSRAIALNENTLPNYVPFKRDENYLMFTVREPFPSKITGTKIIQGTITAQTPLKISSNMPENGVIFSDGIESDYLEFNSGKTAIIQPSQKKIKRILSSGADAPSLRNSS